MIFQKLVLPETSLKHWRPLSNAGDLIPRFNYYKNLAGQIISFKVKIIKDVHEEKGHRKGQN